MSVNRRTRRFHELFAQLPRHIQELAALAFEKFEQDPAHPALRWHQLNETHRGHHQPGSFSVSINKQYRAIYFVGENGVNVWYWIGTHSDYNHFTGVN